MNRGWQRAMWMVLAAALVACRPAPATRAPLVVFAAASLDTAYTEIGAAFSAAHPDTTFSFNFAGSQQLAHQLAQGAPGDLFAAANQRQMQAVVDAGRVARDAPQIFATNRLVVILPAANPAQITALADLARPGVRLVLAAAAVPVGGYALAFLDHAAAAPEFGPAYREGVLANTVSYEENVAAVVSKVALGEADAGIVYASDIANDADTVAHLTIPDHLNVVAEYPLAVLSDAAQPGLAQAFVAFVLGPEGQAILAKHGFLPAPTP